jgi:hypothetical protein
MGRRGERERQCESEVKDVLEKSHKKCDKQRNGKKVRGEFLNRLAGGSSVLEEEREFQVCAAIAARTKGMRRKKRARSPVTEIRRSDRLSGEVETPHPLETTTSPRRTTFSADIEHRTSPRINLGSLIGYEARSAEAPNTTNSTTGNSTPKSFVNGVGERAKVYRKSYKNLSMRERSRRVGKLAQEVLAACIDRTALEFSYASGEEIYLEGNEDLAVDFLTVLDAMRHRVQREMK